MRECVPFSLKSGLYSREASLYFGYTKLLTAGRDLERLSGDGFVVCYVFV